MSDTESHESPSDAASPEAADHTPPQRRVGRVRAAFWLVLLLGAMGLWVAFHYHDGFRRQIGDWLVPLQQAMNSESAEKTAAEQQARQSLVKLGVLVIAEPGDRAVSSVSFSGGDTSNETLKLLEPLYRLTSLNFGGTEIGDAQLSSLESLQSLASLVLSDTRVTDEGLAKVAKLKRLESLHLRNTQVTNAGLAHLAKLPELKILDLSQTKITDDGLRALAPMKQLHWLLIYDDAITDEGLRHLHTVKSLRQVTLSGTKTTPQGVAALKKALPGLTVD